MKGIASDFGADVTVWVPKSADLVIKWSRLWENLTSSFGRDLHQFSAQCNHSIPRPVTQ